MHDTQHRLADQLTQQGQLEAALDVLATLCSKDPSDVTAWHKQAIINSRLGRFEQALACSRQLLALRPADYAALVNMASACTALGQLDTARGAYRQATGINPRNTAAHLGLAALAERQGNTDEAIRTYARVVDLEPEDADTHIKLGKLHQQAENFDEAVSHFRAALRTQPDNRGLLFLLARCHTFARQYPEAEVVCRDILLLDPGQFETHMLLGRIQQLKGEPQRASEFFHAAGKLQPTRAEPFYRTGQILAEAGAWQAAIEQLNKAIALKPDYADACLQLGMVYHATGSPDRAISLIKQALEIDPQHALAYNNLGMVIHESNEIRPEQAEGYYRKALELDDSLSRPYANLGYLYLQQGDYERAIEYYRAARARNDTSPDAFAGEASALERFGEPGQAYMLIEPLIEGHRHNERLALTFAQLSRHHKRLGDAIDWLEDILKQPAINANRRIEAHFALGKLYDINKDHDAAFAHFKAANDLKPGRFDSAECASTAQRICKVFNAEFMRTAPHSGRTGASPIFIVGMSRSGTSLAEQILASHPEVFGAGELTAIPDMANALPASLNTTAPFPECAALLDREALDRLADSHLQQLSRLSGSTARVTDKLPGNYMYLGFIELLFPDARIIHCNRNPLDTCLSCYFQNFSNGHSYTYKLEDLAVYYRWYNAMMEHWRSVLQAPMLELQYENLIAEPETVVREILEFCQLEWHPGCLDFHTSKRIVQTASYDQVRQPIYADSAGRWRNYARHIDSLSRAIETKRGAR